MARDQIKKSWELLHPQSGGDSPEELKKLIARAEELKKREGKSGKQLVAEALEAKYPQDKGSKESANVKLAKIKVEKGVPLSPKDRYALGFGHLHGEVEDDKN